MFKYIIVTLTIPMVSLKMYLLNEVLSLGHHLLLLLQKWGGADGLRMDYLIKGQKVVRPWPYLLHHFLRPCIAISGHVPSPPHHFLRPCIAISGHVPSPPHHFLRSCIAISGHVPSLPHNTHSSFTWNLILSLMNGSWKKKFKPLNF